MMIATGPQRRRSYLPLLVQVGLLGGVLCLLAFLLVMGRPDPIVSGYQEIEVTMPRAQAEQILGAGKVISTKIEQIDGKDTRIEILEWRTADGRQCIRLELADDTVVGKSLHNLGSGGLGSG